MRLTPAEYVISVFGGVRATAKAIGRCPAAVSRWRQSRDKKGSAGRVPGLAHATILSLARTRRLDIHPNDLICGRVVKKIKKSTQR